RFLLHSMFGVGGSMFDVHFSTGPAAEAGSVSLRSVEKGGQSDQFAAADKGLPTRTRNKRASTHSILGVARIGRDWKSETFSRCSRERFNHGRGKGRGNLPARFGRGIKKPEPTRALVPAWKKD
ncbi:MAG: hypothetical protein KGJ13_10805, partial [Patescibacteria group bacterium]|nr:hypothetical protein [Patescibacteria group bacterium]